MAVAVVLNEASSDGVERLVERALDSEAVRAIIVLVRGHGGRRLVCARLGDGGWPVERGEFRTAELGEALLWAGQEQAVILNSGDPQVMAQACAGEAAAPVRAAVVYPAGGRAAPGWTGCVGRRCFGFEPAVLAAPWCRLPSSVLRRLAGDGPAAPDLLPCVLLRAWRDGRLEAVGTAGPTGAPTRGACRRGLLAGIELTFLPRAVAPWARRGLLVSLLVAALGLAGVTVGRAGDAFRSAAAGRTCAPFGDIPEAELRVLLPREGRVAFVSDDGGGAEISTYLRLQNRLLPLVIENGSEGLAAGRIAHVVMRFADRARETEFMQRHGLELAGRCARGFTVGQAAQ